MTSATPEYIGYSVKYIVSYLAVTATVMATGTATATATATALATEMAPATAMARAVAMLLLKMGKNVNLRLERHVNRALIYFLRSVLKKWTLLEYITNTLNVPVVNATMILRLMGYF